MAKFYGVIGYGEVEETSAGVWEEVITERAYKGDILRNTRRWENGQQLNDDLTINNSFSVVADAYAYQNFCEMYEAYDELGGNGMVTKMKQEIDELHLKQKGE